MRSQRPFPNSPPKAITAAIRRPLPLRSRRGERARPQQRPPHQLNSENRHDGEEFEPWRRLQTATDSSDSKAARELDKKTIPFSSSPTTTGIMVSPRTMMPCNSDQVAYSSPTISIAILRQLHDPAACILRERLAHWPGPKPDIDTGPSEALGPVQCSRWFDHVTGTRTQTMTFRLPEIVSITTTVIAIVYQYNNASGASASNTRKPANQPLRHRAGHQRLGLRGDSRNHHQKRSPQQFTARVTSVPVPTWRPSSPPTATTTPLYQRQPASG